MNFFSPSTPLVWRQIFTLLLSEDDSVIHPWHDTSPQFIYTQWVAK